MSDLKTISDSSGEHSGRLSGGAAISAQPGSGPTIGAMGSDYKTYTLDGSGGETILTRELSDMKVKEKVEVFHSSKPKHSKR